MIFAAGLGTRLLDETADKPKALVEIGGKTLLEHAIEKVLSCGVTKIVVNVHHFSKQVIDFIESRNWSIPILISDESNLLLETGGGLKKAAHLFSGKVPILLYNVDILGNVDLNKLEDNHLQSGALATLSVRDRITQRYFKFDEQMQLVGWINKKTGETKVSSADNFKNARELAFSGIHIIQSELLSYLPDENRFSIVEVYLELAKTKMIKGFHDDSELWMDVGKPDELKKVRELFQ